MKRNWLLKLNNKVLIALICLLLATMLSFGGVFAKYYYDYDKGINVQSPEFYFSSDLLTENNDEYVLNPGTSSIEFVVKNHDDALRYSASDVAYTIMATSGDLSAKSGTLSGVSAYDTITLSGLKDGETYTVTAVGTMGSAKAQGFKNTISATFTVKLGQPMIYMYATSDDYVVNLTVYTETLEGNVTVDFPDGLIPDNSCVGLENVKTTDDVFVVNGFTKYSSMQFSFFKTASYAEQPFVVTLVNDANETFTAIDKVPN